MKLELSYPVKIPKITQKFGNENVALYGAMKHNGIDFAAKHGEPIYASHDGLASYQVDGSGGHGVVVITDKEYRYGDGQSFFKTIYWHLCDGTKEPQYESPVANKTGFIPVKRGDIIGFADNTGHSTGDHLHFGLKPVAKGEAWGTWYNLEQTNGYYGAIDPEPYLPKLSLGINYQFDKNMQLGSKNKDVHVLQTILQKLGFYDGKIDGIYGQKTQVAVLAFQVQYGVCKPFQSVYGYYCGPRTRSKLNELLKV